MGKRKHYTMMSWDELKTLKRTVDKTQFEFREYALERMITRGISTREVMSVINENKILEYHINGNSPRVLLKGSPNKRKQCTCVVLDLLNNCIVTTYQNYHTDRHLTLNQDLYSNEIDIINNLKSWGVTKGVRKYDYKRNN